MLKSTTGWSYGNGVDLYGFSALPGGFCYTDGSFGDAGYYGFWWSATEVSAAYTYSRYISSDSVGEGEDDKTRSYSVRCLRD